MKPLRPSERRALWGLAAFVLGTLMVVGVWQPARQNLAQATLRVEQQLELANRLAQAQPVRQTGAQQPLAPFISESARRANLELQQLDIAGPMLNVAVTGDALAVLAWLQGLEAAGAHLHSLALQPKGALLQARAGVTNRPDR